MKVFTLLSVICVFLIIASVANSETTQDSQSRLISQRIRSIRESFRDQIAKDSNKTKPVDADDDDDDDDDAWNIGSFFGEVGSKVNTFFKGAVGNLLECVDDVFGCLDPNGSKKKKKQKEEKPEPKPQPKPTLVPPKPTMPSSDGGQGGARQIKPTIGTVAKTTQKGTTEPNAPANSAADGTAGNTASTEKPTSTPASVPVKQSLTSAGP